MKRSRDIIEFPANPFVALADVLIVLLLILLLALLHQSVSSSRLIERMAVADLQNRLVSQAKRPMQDSRADRILQAAFTEHICWQYYVDGDLQRLRVDGATLFDDKSRRLSSGTSRERDPIKRAAHTPEQLLAAIGEVLARNQGDLNDPGSGLFKRIYLQGNAGPTEGRSDAELWQLSQDRALAAASVLQHHTPLSPRVFEVSAKGVWDPADELKPGMDDKQRARVAANNRRLDIVIIYSGKRAMQYLSHVPITQSSSASGGRR